MTDGFEKKAEIREQIEYDILCQQYDRMQLDELVEIMLEVAINRSPTVKIGRDAEYPTGFVQQRFEKITSMHIEKVMDGIRENTTRVWNTKAYGDFSGAHAFRYCHYCGSRNSWYVVRPAPAQKAFPKSWHCRMMAGEKKQRRIDQIDGRTVLFLTLCACLVTFLTTSFWGHGIFTFWIFLILCWFGLYKQAIGCFAVYLVAIVWLMIETKYQISIPSPLLLSMIYKLLLPAMPAYLLAKIPSGKLTASLRKMPIPTRIMLVLIVMLRFAPTVLHEFGEVREAMKIRGFLKSVGNVLRHPMDTLEYAIVPMVFRSLKIADELAASAIVRGIESPYKKESYYVSRIAALDYYLIVVSVGAAVCCCLL